MEHALNNLLNQLCVSAADRWGKSTIGLTTVAVEVTFPDGTRAHHMGHYRAEAPLYTESLDSSSSEAEADISLQEDVDQALDKAALVRTVSPASLHPGTADLTYRTLLRGLPWMFVDPTWSIPQPAFEKGIADILIRTKPIEGQDARCIEWYIKILEERAVVQVTPTGVQLRYPDIIAAASRNLQTLFCGETTLPASRFYRRLKIILQDVSNPSYRHDQFELASGWLDYWGCLSATVTTAGYLYTFNWASTVFPPKRS
jgi:hypothetical protein